MDLGGKTILVAGGTGSFGVKLVETILADHDPQSVRVFSWDELKQSDLQRRFADETRLGRPRARRTYPTDKPRSQRAFAAAGFALREHGEDEIVATREL